MPSGQATPGQAQLNVQTSLCMCAIRSALHHLASRHPDLDNHKQWPQSTFPYPRNGIAFAGSGGMDRAVTGEISAKSKEKRRAHPPITHHCSPPARLSSSPSPLSPSVSILLPLLSRPVFSLQHTCAHTGVAAEEVTHILMEEEGQRKARRVTEAPLFFLHLGYLPRLPHLNHGTGNGASSLGFAILSLYRLRSLWSLTIPQLKSVHF